MRYDELPPGAIIPANEEPVIVNAGLTQTSVQITNTGDVPVHITAHYHVFEANPKLRFDRRKGFGMRPDVPAGGAVRIEPGETVDVPIVPIGGNQIVRGFHGLVDGPLDNVDPGAAVQLAIDRGFLHKPEE